MAAYREYEMAVEQWNKLLTSQDVASHGANAVQCVDAVMEALGVTGPQHLREYLRYAGQMSIGDTELLGWHRGVPSHLDIIRINAAVHADLGEAIPLAHIIMATHDLGDYYCVEESGGVYRWNHELDEREVLAESILEWLSGVIERQDWFLG